ncbi:amidase, partial [Leucobacter sp. M11]|uniref:amidase n=1 Tax=Leucobacter sp. M11 TaxID=2993565 RepID=UPI002D80C450
SFLARFPVTARAAAEEHDRAVAAGAALPPLSGVPLGIKAMLGTRERDADAQSLVADPDASHGEDAASVAALRGAGAVILGHNTMVEHAMGRPDPLSPFPVPRNPWDLERWPGGSSSGTANGVAAGLFAGGLGTDTTGSIRIPAAFCGLTGFAPSHDLVPTAGCLPAAPSLDVVGPIVPSARDARLLMSVLAPGFDAPDSGPRSGRDPRRIGVPEELLGAERGVDPATRAAVAHSLSTLEAAGYRVEAFPLPEFDELVQITLGLSLAEVHAGHRERLSTDWHRYGRSFRRIAAAGAAFPPDTGDALRARAARLRDALGARLAEYTAIATPTWPTGAAPYAASGGLPVPETNFTAAWSAVGFPSLSLPAGRDGNGMPLGLLLTGAPGTDGRVLGAGEALQRRDRGHLARPDLGEHPLPMPRPVPDPDASGEPGAVVPPNEQPAWL